MNPDYKFNASLYAKMGVSWPMLEELSRKGCECGHCEQSGKAFTADNPMELGVKCHTGSPVYVSYWDGWLYVRCGFCDKPAMKIPVNRSLL